MPPKRKGKKGTKQSEPFNVKNTRCNVDTNVIREEKSFIEQEVERQNAAIRTIREAEIEKLLTSIRLLQSSMTKEQLHTPLLQFLKENLPNLTLSRNEENGSVQVKWKDKHEDLSMNTAGGGNLGSSFLQHMSMAYPAFSHKAATTSFIGADYLQTKDFVLDGPSDTHNLGIEDSMQTPGVTNQRLSVGMAPKTLRLPKPGEMLLSVHGSPLGVFKENNMDALHAGSMVLI